MDKLTLWYKQPAEKWLDGLPIGNGTIGAMVMGGTAEERLALNHESLWRGLSRNRTTGKKSHHLPEIRRRFFEEDIKEAGEYANKILCGPEHAVQPYQPFGDLKLEFDGHENAQNYKRRLDMTQGIASVEYSINDVTYRREAFVSYVHQVIVLNLTCDTPASIKTCIGLSRISDDDCAMSPWTEDNALGFSASFPEGISFGAEARVIQRGGRQYSESSGTICVENANEVSIILALETEHQHTDSIRASCQEHINSIPMDYQELFSAHTADHSKLFGNLSLNLGDDNSKIPTDERLQAMRDGAEDLALMSLYYQFGRYLLIASSRPGGLPANLQGIWNEMLKPPWDADFHLDLNLQMNYWPAEVCGLSECAEPVFDFFDNIVPEAQKVAMELYGARGIYIPITTDVWAKCTPEAPGWDVWTGAAAWLSQHYWWHYEFTQDKAFLKDRAYPFLRQIATFYEDYLIEDSSSDYLVTVPSQSPENRIVGGCEPVSLCIAATMDLELIHHVFTCLLDASRILGIDEKERAGWQNILDSIPPLQIGSYGQIQEWLHDYEEVEPGHRHLSHLFALFPGDQITIEETPELAQAARTTLERREAHTGGYCGWTHAWMACCWARLGEGNRAWKHIRPLLTDFTTISFLDLIFGDCFQIDGNFGGTAAVTEMLLQSHNGLIRILPALPEDWPEGSISGLIARGGFEIDIIWKQSKLHDLTILSRLGQEARLRIDTPGEFSIMHGEVEVDYTVADDGEYIFPTTAGEIYKVSLK